MSNRELCNYIWDNRAKYMQKLGQTVSFTVDYSTNTVRYVLLNDATVIIKSVKEFYNIYGEVTW